MNTKTQPQTPSSMSTAAATDVSEFITDLDGGQFDRLLSIALSQTASAVVDHQKRGRVTVVFDFETIAGTHQVRVAHNLKFTKPTSMGRSSEETDGASVLYVGKYGALSLAQPDMFEGERASAQRRIPD
jgi:hypothetical protein